MIKRNSFESGLRFDTTSKEPASTTFYYGLELEQSSSSNQVLCDETFHRTLLFDSTEMSFKRDGSLANGWEYITQPMSLAKHHSLRMKYDDFFSKGSNLCKYNAHDSASTHIHFSYLKDDYTVEQGELYRLYSNRVYCLSKTGSSKCVNCPKLSGTHYSLSTLKTKCAVHDCPVNKTITASEKHSYFLLKLYYMMYGILCAHDNLSFLDAISGRKEKCGVFHNQYCHMTPPTLNCSEHYTTLSLRTNTIECRIWGPATSTEYVLAILDFMDFYAKLGLRLVEAYDRKILLADEPKIFDFRNDKYLTLLNLSKMPSFKEELLKEFSNENTPYVYLRKYLVGTVQNSTPERDLHILPIKTHLLKTYSLEAISSAVQTNSSTSKEELLDIAFSLEISKKILNIICSSLEEKQNILEVLKTDLLRIRRASLFSYMFERSRHDCLDPLMNMASEIHTANHYFFYTLAWSVCLKYFEQPLTINVLSNLIDAYCAVEPVKPLTMYTLAKKVLPKADLFFKDVQIQCKIVSDLLLSQLTDKIEELTIEANRTVFDEERADDYLL